MIPTLDVEGTREGVTIDMVSAVLKKEIGLLGASGLRRDGKMVRTRDNIDGRGSVEVLREGRVKKL